MCERDGVRVSGCVRERKRDRERGREREGKGGERVRGDDQD